MNIEKIAAISFRRSRSSTTSPGDKFSATRTDLVIARMMIRETMKTIQRDKDEIRDLERREKKLKQQGIAITFLGPWIETRKERLKKLNKAFTTTGAIVMDMLDCWERSGATLRDLCNLCNRDYAQVKTETDLIGNAAAGKGFGDLMFVFDIDYPAYESGDFIEDTADAPFTQVALAFMRDQMLHTPEGQWASDEAFKAVFPEL